MVDEETVDAVGGTAHSVRVHTVGAERTRAVAAAVAAHLGAGDVVLLTGGLAAGKTTFVAGAVAALGSDDAVTSPTFALAQFYRTSGAPVLHIDTYRLEDLAEFRDLGLEEYLEEAVTLVEWGGLVAAEFTDPLWVELAPHPEAPDTRVVTVTSAGPRWDGVLDGLAPDLRRAAA